MVKPENRVEKYAFLRLYDHDFEMALQTVKILRRYKKNDVRHALLRDLVVTYCRPFKESRGKGIKKDYFGINKFKSENMESLHNKLLKLRSSLFAHTDFNFKNPRVAKLPLEGKALFAMAFKHFNYKELDSELSGIVNLIKYVRNELSKQLNKYEHNFS